MRDFLLRELGRAGLGDNTFTPAALDLVVRSANGVLKRWLDEYQADRPRTAAATLLVKPE